MQGKKKYNKNRLARIVKIQDVTLEHTRRGVTQQWVFDNIVHPTYFICQSTYYEYLRTPAKQILKELEK